jgi:ribosomal 50S subunit-associated protein YjgA (DUF615 family)
MYDTLENRSTVKMTKEEVFSDRPDLKTYFGVDWAKKGEVKCVEIRVSVTDTETFKAFIDEFKKLQEENKELKRKLEILREALVFYADKSNWQKDDYNHWIFDSYTNDDEYEIYRFKYCGGKRARQALKELGE